MSTCRRRCPVPVLLFLFVSLLQPSVAMSQTSPNDFSERLDKLWEFSKPAESETRFRAELARHPPSSREALETSTQIARAHGLQLQAPMIVKYRDASADAAVTLEEALR